MANEWLDCDANKMTSGQCKMNVHGMLGIKGGEDSTVSSDNFIQDLFTGTTFFIGTLVTIGLIASALYMIFAGGEQKWAQEGKKGIQSAIIGLLLVIFSYGIVRLIGYLAKG